MLDGKIWKELVSRPKSDWELAKSVEQCERIINRNTKIIQEWQKNNKPVVIMCPPTFYDFVDNIPVAGNGFVVSGYTEFNKDKKANTQKGIDDWCAFQKLLIDRGVAIINIDPSSSEKLSAQVFTADPSQSYVYISGNHSDLKLSHAMTVLSKFANFARKAEVTETKKLFESLKNTPCHSNLFANRKIVESKEELEGTGDNLIDPYRGVIVSGYGMRNTRESLQKLEAVTGIPVYGIKSKEPFFHVDTYVSVLPGGYVMYAPEVMTEEGVQQLESALFKNHDALKSKYGLVVSKADAENFVCNAVVINNDIIMQPCSETLRQQLIAKGFNVVFTDAKVMNYGGGGLHCMTNKFNQPIYYHPRYTLAQAIRNDIVNGCEERVYRRQEYESIKKEVENICNIAATKIQKHFKLWQIKKILAKSDMELSSVRYK